MSNKTDAIPDLLVGIAPTIGSVWIWEPLNEAARCRVVVTGVRWDGRDVWVEAETSAGLKEWNELSRWVEATVLVDPGEA
jgi:hypothetical protein